MKKYSLNIDERVNRGVDLFMAGHNCAQSVVGAFADIYGISFSLAMRMAASFGAGIGRQRLTCGAVSGMCLLAGLENGSADIDPRVRGVNYALVQQLCDAFRAENGSITCAELLGMKQALARSAVPSERNAEYYAKRPCARMVASACRIFATYLESLQMPD